MAPGSKEEAELLEAIKPWLEKMVPRATRGKK
jgi:hypothetical protein